MNKTFEEVMHRNLSLDERIRMGLVPESIASELQDLDEAHMELYGEAYRTGFDDARAEIMGAVEAVAMDKTLDLKRSTLLAAVNKKLSQDG